MSFQDFQDGVRKYELNQERKATLNDMTALIQEASRANIQGLLKLPDAIRIKWIDEDSNNRVMLKERMKQFLEKESGDEIAEKRRLIQKIIEGIDEVDRITAELDSLSKDTGNESDPPEDPDPEPDSGSSSGSENAANAA